MKPQFGALTKRESGSAPMAIFRQLTQLQVETMCTRLLGAQAMQLEAQYSAQLQAELEEQHRIFAQFVREMVSDMCDTVTNSAISTFADAEATFGHRRRTVRLLVVEEERFVDCATSGINLIHILLLCLAAQYSSTCHSHKPLVRLAPQRQVLVTTNACISLFLVFCSNGCCFNKLLCAFAKERT